MSNFWTIAFLVLLSMSSVLTAGDIELDGRTWNASVDGGRLSRQFRIATTVSVESGEAIGFLSVDSKLLPDADFKWQVHVSAIDSNLPEGVRIMIRRTGTGDGKGKIDGGETYRVCQAHPLLWFEGTGARESIPYQYVIDGLSITTPPGRYSVAILVQIVEVK